MIRDDLDTLVQHLLDRGILFEDAQREFERMFITRALAKTNYNVCKAAKITGREAHRDALAAELRDDARNVDALTAGIEAAGLHADGVADR